MCTQRTYKSMKIALTGRAFLHSNALPLSYTSGLSHATEFATNSTETSECFSVVEEEITRRKQLGTLTFESNRSAFETRFNR